MNKQFIIIFSVVLIVLVSGVYAKAITPPGNINLRNYYSIFNAKSINASGNISTLQYLCLSGDCRSSWAGIVDTWNTTPQMVRAANLTGLLVNWSTKIVSGGGNTTAQIITATNSTKLLINWSTRILTDIGNLSSLIISSANSTGLLVNWSTKISGGGNTSKEMIDAINNTALILWAKKSSTQIYPLYNNVGIGLSSYAPLSELHVGHVSNDETYTVPIIRFTTSYLGQTVNDGGYIGYDDNTASLNITNLEEGDFILSNYRKEVIRMSSTGNITLKKLLNCRGRLYTDTAGMMRCNTSSTGTDTWNTSAQMIRALAGNLSRLQNSITSNSTRERNDNTTQQTKIAAINSSLNTKVGALNTNTTNLRTGVNRNQTREYNDNLTQQTKIASLNSSLVNKISLLHTNISNNNNSIKINLSDLNNRINNAIDTNTWNTSIQMQRAVNKTGLNGTYFKDLQCSQIWFNNGKGSAGICDGTDDGGAGSGNTTVQIIRAVNGTALNLIKAFDFNFSRLLSCDESEYLRYTNSNIITLDSTNSGGILDMSLFYDFNDDVYETDSEHIYIEKETGLDMFPPPTNYNQVSKGTQGFMISSIIGKKVKNAIFRLKIDNIIDKDKLLNIIVKYNSSYHFTESWCNAHDQICWDNSTQGISIGTVYSVASYEDNGYFDFNVTYALNDALTKGYNNISFIITSNFENDDKIYNQSILAIFGAYDHFPVYNYLFIEVNNTPEWNCYPEIKYFYPNITQTSTIKWVNNTNLLLKNLTIKDVSNCRGRLYTDYFGKIKCNTSSSGIDTFNTTSQMITAVNSTKLLINWSTKISSSSGNTTAQMIRALAGNLSALNLGITRNATRESNDNLTQKTRYELILTNLRANITNNNNSATSYFNYKIGLLHTNISNNNASIKINLSNLNGRINAIVDTNTWNTTLQMIRAVNITRLNATYFRDINCSQIKFTTGKGNTAICDGLDATGGGSIYYLQRPYIYNSSTIGYFNETKLNKTIKFYGNTTTQMIKAVNSSLLRIAKINVTNTLYSNITRIKRACIWVNSTGAIRIESVCTI